MRPTVTREHAHGRRNPPRGEAIAVDIQHLLDELDGEVNAGRRIPVGGGVVVDRRRMLDLIEELRTAIPAAVRQARAIIERGEQAIQEAEAAAAHIIADAEREADLRVSQSALTRAAQERGHQLEIEAEERAHRMLIAAQADAERQLAEGAERARAQEEEADRYALAVLSGLEERIAGYLASIRQAKAQMEG